MSQLGLALGMDCEGFSESEHSEAVVLADILRGLGRTLGQFGDLVN